MSTGSTSTSSSRRSRSRRMIRLAEPPSELNVVNFNSNGTSNNNNNNNNNRNSILISNTRSIGSNTSTSLSNSNNNNTSTSTNTNNERIPNVLQSSSNSNNNSEVLVAKSSMRFIQGRPYIVYKSELARVVVMQSNDDSNDTNNDYNNNNNYNNSTTKVTTSRIPVPVSNLTMLLNEQLGIPNVETQQQQITEMTLQVRTITNTDDSPVSSVLVRNNMILPTRRNSYNATVVATAPTTGVAGVAACTTIVGSGSSVSEADSASGPPPRQCQSKPKVIVLGSSALSHLTAQSRVVMFEPPDNVNTNNDTTYVPEKLPTYNNNNIQQQPKHIISLIIKRDIFK
jgi:hypothetical protein